MQTFLIGGCPFCGNQDCIAGQCQSVQVEEVFAFPEELTGWQELPNGMWEFRGEQGEYLLCTKSFKDVLMKHPTVLEAYQSFKVTQDLLKLKLKELE